MFHKGSTGRGFSETIRHARYHPLESPGGRFSDLVSPQKGGSRTKVGAARSVPASDKNMDGKVGRVPAGAFKKGSKPPANPINRLGAFGHPPKGTSKGMELPKDHEGMPSKTPANMDGKNDRVPRGGRRAGKRATKFDPPQRINRGTPPGFQTKDLAAKL